MPNQTASSDAAGTCSFLLLTVVTDSNATAGAAIPAQTTVAVAGTYFFSMLTVATDVNTSDTGRQTDVPDIETECGEDILKGDDDSEFGDDGGDDGLGDYEEPDESNDRYYLRLNLLT
jgi:hypothetical protein